MKVKISKQESYDIELPDEVSIIELAEISRRFSDLVKVFGRIDQQMQSIVDGQSNPTVKATRKSYKGVFDLGWRKNRDEALEMCKVHYLGTNEERDEIAKRYGYPSYDKISQGLSGVRKVQRINPKEVGLKRFPISTGETHALRAGISTLKLETKETSNDRDDLQITVKTQKSDKPKVKLE